MELMRRVIDPAVRLSVPILAVSVSGWWIQIARRLVWVTSETEDEGRLIEPLLDNTMTGDKPVPLAAVEPILIAAPMTRQPAEWAFTARIWTEGSSASHRSAVEQDREGYSRPRHTDRHPRSRLDSLRDCVPVGLEGLLARLHRERRVGTGERRLDGVPR